VGCQRGAFKSKILPLHICAQDCTLVLLDSYEKYFSKMADDGYSLAAEPLETSLIPIEDGIEQPLHPKVEPNIFLAESNSQRKQYLSRLYQDDESKYERGTLFYTIDSIEIRYLFQDCLSGSDYSLANPAQFVALTPLKDCILDIVWELSEIPDSPNKVPGELESLLRLLPAAARYQAKYESRTESVCRILFDAGISEKLT
jgi:hypothetical protein